MSIFHFRQFDVINEASAMKVNTDGVLLGAAVTLPANCRNVLDIGTGTGTIALMIAQRLNTVAKGFQIDAIDIDRASATEAAANFEASPWGTSLSAHHCALEHFEARAEYDLIVSNPPYFDDSLLNPDERESTARHSISMSYRDILTWSSEHLSSAGHVALVLPIETEAALLREARSYGLFPCRILRIRTTPRKAARRIIAEFSFTRQDEGPAEETLTLQDPVNCPDTKDHRTPEYLNLTSEFYI